MRKRKLSVIMFAVALCCVLFVGLSSCTPAYSAGVPVLGVSTNGESEIELKSVDYRFYVEDYPSYQDFKDTKSTVAVAYTFFNTSMQDVTMPLYLKVGRPEYALQDDVDIISRYQFLTSSAQKIGLRCAYGNDLSVNYYDGMPKIENFLEKLNDERQTDDYYNGSLPVYKYTFKFSDLSDEVGRIRFRLDSEYDDVKIFCGDDRFVYYSVFDVFKFQYVYLEDGFDSLTLYSVGKELIGIEEKIEFCTKSETVIQNGGKIASVIYDSVSFDDLLMTYYDEASGLSSVDWYNAALSYVKDNKLESLRNLHYFDMTQRMSYMYECFLTVPAQTEVTYAVLMPLYPDIDWGRTEDVYIYDLDISALSNWQGYPTVRASIVTKGYQVKASYYAELIQTATGFEIEGNDLSKPTLSFALSERLVSSSNGQDALNRLGKAFLIVAAIIALIPIVAVWTVIGVDASKRKKALKAEKESTATDGQNGKL